MDFKNDLVDGVVERLEDKFGYEVHKFDIDAAGFVRNFLKVNPLVFEEIHEERTGRIPTGKEIISVMNTILPSFERKVKHLKKNA